jgi:hypothetical protein
MKTAILKISIIIFFLQTLISGVNATEKPILERSKRMLFQEQSQELNVRKIKRDIRKAQTRPAFHLLSKSIFSPKLSVALLDNKGIHLFTISNVSFMPTINVGAKIKIGFVITI